MKIGIDGSFPLYENLKNMDYKKENSFPPASTLYRQITALEKKLSTLHALQQLTERTDSQWDIDNNYRDALLDYVEELDKLYDIAFLIIRNVSLVADEEPNDAIKWVKKYESLKFERLNGAIKKEQEWIRLISNLKKHDDIRVGFINMKTKTGKIIYGFFFGSIIDGYFSPISGVHKPYIGNQTAYSYNRFVNQTVSFIFKVLNELNKILFSDCTPTNSAQQPFISILNIIKILSTTKNIFFPDEYSNNFVSYQKTKNGYTLKCIKLKYTDKYMSTSQIHMLDNQGYKGYTIPYFTLIFGQN